MHHSICGHHTKANPQQKPHYAKFATPCMATCLLGFGFQLTALAVGSRLTANRWATGQSSHNNSYDTPRKDPNLETRSPRTSGNSRRRASTTHLPEASLGCHEIRRESRRIHIALGSVTHEHGRAAHPARRLDFQLTQTQL